MCCHACNLSMGPQTLAHCDMKVPGLCCTLAAMECCHPSAPLCQGFAVVHYYHADMDANVLLHEHSCWGLLWWAWSKQHVSIESHESTEHLGTAASHPLCQQRGTLVSEQTGHETVTDSCLMSGLLHIARVGTSKASNHKPCMPAQQVRCCASRLIVTLCTRHTA
jgi:hypothetical protein